MKGAMRRHPENLLWYAGGGLEPEEAAVVERHLAACRECRREAAALQSMARSLRGQASTDHATSAELIAWLDGGIHPGGPRSRFLDEHLRACGECASDLQRLRDAGAVEGKLRALREVAVPGTRPGATRRIIAYAAGAVLVAGIGAWGILRTVSSSPSGAAEPGIVFAPSQRGESPEGRLVRPGPWIVRVILPFGAPSSAYRARISRESEDAPSLFESDVDSVSSGVAKLALPDDLEPGRYRLALIPAEAGTADAYLYDFDVAEAR